MKTHDLPHLKRHGEVTQLMVGAQPFLVLGGEVRNSSASSLDYLAAVLDHAVTLNVNTALVPIYWELLEPEEGRLDFALVDGLLAATRARGLKLIPLWFGTMKNATSCYVPAWVKRDTQRFPRAQTTPGRPSGTISCFNEAAACADARAFAALMRHIREKDAHEQTVIMVQVENEPGLLGAPRDCSPLAEKAFSGSPPSGLMDYLQARRGTLMPELGQLWEAQGARRTGSWSDVFGPAADEVFMAWHVAHFVNTVAAAGRAEYDLPMFANAWLVHGPGYAPGMYPSGGPVSKMMDVWRAAAPALDLLAPDIYDADFRSVCADYARPGNPLLIPEARNASNAAARALYAFGRHAALGFSPFAIEDVPVSHPLAETYRLLAHAMGALAEAQQRCACTAFLQQEDEGRWTAELAGYRVHAAINKRLDDQCPGSALVMAFAGNEFVVLGRRMNITFSAPTDEGAQAEFLWMDEGSYADGKWNPTRRLNGDETYHGTTVRLGEGMQLVRVAIHIPI